MSGAVNVRDRRRRPFYMVENDVLDRYGHQLGPYGIALYNGLVRYANAEGRCNPSIATLAALVGMSPRQARATLRKLEDLGLVESEAAPAGSAQTYALRTVADVAPAPHAAPAHDAAPAPHADATSATALRQGTPAPHAAPAPRAAKQDINHSDPFANAQGSATPYATAPGVTRPPAAPRPARAAKPAATRPPRTKRDEHWGDRIAVLRAACGIGNVQQARTAGRLGTVASRYAGLTGADLAQRVDLALQAIADRAHKPRAALAPPSIWQLDEALSALDTARPFRREDYRGAANRDLRIYLPSGERRPLLDALVRLGIDHLTPHEQLPDELQALYADEIAEQRARRDALRMPREDAARVG